MAPAILWYRRDLRVHDLPALQAAMEDGGDDGVIPVFCFDDKLIHGRFPSARRTAYLLETLKALDERWHDLGGRLWWRRGEPSKELAKLVEETGATQVHATEDVTGFARARDDRAAKAIADAGGELHLHTGLAISSDLES